MQIDMSGHDNPGLVCHVDNKVDGNDDSKEPQVATATIRD
jgi:hypothetical protein